MSEPWKEARPYLWSLLAVILVTITSCTADTSYSNYLDAKVKIACVQNGKSWEVIDVEPDDEVTEMVGVCR